MTRKTFKRIAIAVAVLNVFLLTCAYAGQTIGLPQASTMSWRVDALHDFLFWLSVVSLGGTTIVMLYFVVVYHKSRTGRETAYILHNHTAETIWTVIPLILMMGVWAWGYRDYLWLKSEPANPIEINVLGRQWMWNFEYANGRKTMNELYVPKGKPIKLIMTSEDVIHSFSLPNMRVKQDVVPGMYTFISFEPTLVGVHPIYCTMYCGTGHSDMLGRVFVLEPEDYQRWLETGKAPSAIMKLAADEAAAQARVAAESTAGPPLEGPALKGAALYQSKGCVACHSTDGTRKVGPSWKGIWGSDEALEGGATVRVDENYVRESIMDPQAKVVKGFPPSMPPFKGLLSDEEINSLIAYIKSLK